MCVCVYTYTLAIYSVPTFTFVLSYATIYTMAPVFSMVLDEDVSADIALMYPELYQDLMKVNKLSISPG